MMGFAGWLMLPALAHAQSSTEPWRTLETAHYRLHTPVVALPWAEDVATRLEEIRARVSAEVGPGPDQKVDIVLMDPARSPNGFALPLTRHPRMGIFPTAPTASGGLAWYRSWTEDLVTHEDAHLVHLMRPSRNPLWRSSLSLFGVEPMLGVPTWVIEGYATVVEGRLTGTGRPHGDGRAAWLRVLAQDGRLPAYDQLNGTSQWMGRSHRYLVGSAFLEWLEVRRCGPQTDVPAPGACAALPDLWARVTARKLRSFDDAFVGVFGDSPRSLYDQFRAQVGYAAVAQQQQRPGDDSVWQDLKWSTAEPALSADGLRLVAWRRQHGRSSLVVWDTADDPDAQKTWLAPAQQAIERDPQDVLPVPPAVLPRQPLAHREDPFRPARHPRWLPDGRVLMSVWERDRGGQLRPDLFTWDPDSGREERVTRGAELTQADPSPDGRWAVALRRRWGQDELVRVDLESGQITVLSAPPVPVVLDHPRLDLTGQRVVYLRHDGHSSSDQSSSDQSRSDQSSSGQWRVVVRDLATGIETLPQLPAGASASDPTFSADGRMLVLALGRQGYTDLVALDLAQGTVHPLTTTRGATSAPQPTPDGSAVYYLDLDSDGVDLCRTPMDLDRPVLPLALAVPLSQAPPPVRPPVNPDPPSRLQPDPASVDGRAYGVGQTEWMPILGGGAGPGADSTELGLRFGDVIGRHQALLLGAWGQQAGVAGVALRLAWRGPPLGVGGAARFDGFWLTDGPLSPRGGLNLSLGQDRSGPRGQWSWQGGAVVRQGLRSDPLSPTLYGHARVDAAHRLGGRFWLRPSARLGGQLGTSDHALVEAELGLAAGAPSVQLSASFQRAAARSPFALGGLESSLVPTPAQGTWTPVPWLAPDSLSGTRRDALDLSVGSGPVGLFAARHQVGSLDSSLLSRSASAALGARLDLLSPPVPLVRLPGLHWTAGLACVVETPDGVDAQRCKTRSGYAGWLGLTSSS